MPSRCHRGIRSRLALAALLILPSAATAATIVVDTADDADVADADCALREAIVAANTDAAYNGCAAGTGLLDRIEFVLAPPATITLVADLPTVTESVEIVGPGADKLTLDGDDLYLLLAFDTATNDGEFLVADLTLTRGWAAFDVLALRGGGATVTQGETATFARVRFVDNQAENPGGGLYMNSTPAQPATVTLSECLFEGNVAQGASGGGGLYATNGSVLTVSRSTFTGNQATGTSGGGAAMVINSATATIRRSTISGNLANGSGGGIFVFTTGVSPNDVTISDSTITANQSAVTNTSGNGGGIMISPYIVDPVATTVTLRNNIIAGNLDGGTLARPDVECLTTTNFTLVSQGFNLIGSNESTAAIFTAGTPNADGDFVGIADPLLAALADNGGATPTHLPLEDAASSVVDHGDCVQDAGDQRGFVDGITLLRPVDSATVVDHVDSDGCDIGAAELGAVAAPGSAIFADGFDNGTTYAWSSSVP